jgi:hypothetical protein
MHGQSLRIDVSLYIHSLVDSIIDAMSTKRRSAILLGLFFIVCESEFTIVRLSYEPHSLRRRQRGRSCVISVTSTGGT